jgi:hypothetical protein
MRKIEKQMLSAVMQRKDFMLANTSVFYISAAETGNPYGSRSEIYLHGNQIAEFWHDMPEGEKLQVNESMLARWPTPTTKSRLRALGAHVTTTKGATSLNGKVIV